MMSIVVDSSSEKSVEVLVESVAEARGLANRIASELDFPSLVIPTLIDDEPHWRVNCCVPQE